MKNQSLYLIFLFITKFLPAQQLAPAYPLITHDPYFSIWSNSDALNETTTTHWTGAPHSLLGLLKVDGKIFRFLGRQEKVLKALVPAADEKNYEAAYTESAPGNDWTKPTFDASHWKKGIAPFGNDKDESRTTWNTPDIWMRREFTVNQGSSKLFVKLRHDDDVEVFINGEKVYAYKGWTDKFVYVPVPNDIRKKIKKGANILAVHVTNTGGGSWLDAGIAEEQKITVDGSLQTAVQNKLRINATQTIYDFNCGKVDVSLTFTSPLLMNDLSLLSRPVSYINIQVHSNDGNMHDVQCYFGASTSIAANTSSQKIKAGKYMSMGLSILKAGTIEQAVLKKKGDDLRIDWGYMYVAVAASGGVQQYVSAGTGLSTIFQPLMKNQATGKGMMLNTIINLGKVGISPKEQLILLGYDDLYSLQYFSHDLRPWWNQDGKTSIEKELSLAAANYKSVIIKCQAFNEQLYTSAVEAGGIEYAKLCELAYRQSIAAHKLVKSLDGELLFLSKENFSNGSINTVDVTYPSSPLFLLYNPDLLKGMLNGIFYFSESGKWVKPFAAHDLGTYPLANGQTYPTDMPVEECGNMIILTAAIAKTEGNANYAKKHWNTLTSWAEYLAKEGFDPVKQLCTDDFAGHLARNANLSVKAIVALGGYAQLAEQLGEQQIAAKYKLLTSDMVKRWMVLADDGDHYALTFENKGSWSQKYNLVWDKVLGMGLFPKEVYDKEVRYYLTRQNVYGLPLDSRRSYTKSDWITWTAVLASDKEDFKAIIAPVYKYASETKSRVPLSDWHETTDGKMVGFQARSVVGGYFMKMLEQKLLHK